MYGWLVTKRMDGAVGVCMDEMDGMVLKCVHMGWRHPLPWLMIALCTSGTVQQLTMLATSPVCVTSGEGCVCLSACLSLSVCVCVCVCVHACLLFCESTRLSVSLSVFLYVSVCMSVCFYVSVCLCVCVSM